jgi:hypothetical protein
MEVLYPSASIRVAMTTREMGANTGEGASWESQSRIEVAERSPDRLKIKYHYHIFLEKRARFFIILGVFFISAAIITLAFGITEIVVMGIVIGALVLVFTWYYPRQCHIIVVSKEVGEISFSDSSVFSERLPMSIPFGHVKCLTIASETMASKPEHMLSVTLHPAPQGPFHVSIFTRLLVRSYSIDEIEELARIISEFSDIRVVRQV